MKKFLIRAAYLAAFALMLVFAACKDKDDPKEPAVQFSVTPEQINLIVGGETQLVVEPTTYTYSFESTDPGVAMVSTTGLVTAMSEGDAEIKVSVGKTTKPIPVSVGALVLVSEIGVSPTSLEDMEIDAEVTVVTTLLPTNYNEQGPFDLLWGTSDSNVAMVDEGKITAVGPGDATITVSLAKRPAVYTEIPVTVIAQENPITEIVVSAIGYNATLFELYPGELRNMTASFLPLDHTDADTSVSWSSLPTSVATVTSEGKIEAVDTGTATVTVSLDSNPAIKKEITVQVVAAGSNVTVINHPSGSGWSNTTASNFGNTTGRTRANVSLTENNIVVLQGFTPEEIEKMYNRDFMTYNPATGRVTFNGLTATNYSLFWHANYAYLWIVISNGTQPACYWVVGSGFAQAPQWHTDFQSGSWSMTNNRNCGYMRRMGSASNDYQVTLYLVNRTVFDDGLDMQIYNQRNNNTWAGLQESLTLTGDMNDLVLLTGNEIQSGDNFVAGYYRVNFNSSTKVVNFEKVE